MSDFDPNYTLLDSSHVDSRRLKRERQKAKELRKSQWWLEQLNRGVCHYCEERFLRKELTMDHVVPLARGGESKKGNIVPSCAACNQKKKLSIPSESLLNTIRVNSEENEL